ncbi:MAG: PorT family protein [Lascolabacillus sp.]|jgi:hypothetical protein|nr:PorT family protein [Lascolabacillus sp.]
MSDIWQNKLRNRINSYEETAPDGLWEELERQIDSDIMLGEKDISENYISGKVINIQNRKLHRLRSISISAIAAAAVVVLFYLLNIKQDNTIHEPILKENNIDIEFADKSELDLNKEVPDIILAKNNIKPKVTSSNILTTSENKSSETEINNGITLYNEDIVTERVDEPVVIEEQVVNDISKENLEDGNELLIASSSNIDNLKRSRWQTNVSISNTSSGSSETFPGYGTFALKETVNQQYAFLSEYSREGAYTDIKHEQPITLGLTLRYNINDKWNITSGITYSLLSSKLRSQGENYYYDDNQKLHYIGVPLNIAYNFWQNNNFLGYFTAGAHMQKNVCGRLVSNYYIDNQLESTISERITEKELQWSVNSAVGIEYRVSDYLGLYAEPGIDYYFKNSSELKTIYKDRPFSFNLRVGIRFTFND